MNVNKKILQYLEYKEISQRKFTATCRLSEGVLRGGKNIGSGYLLVIKQNYPDLNMNWLLFDEGNMLLTDVSMVNESQELYKNEGSNLEILKNELKNCEKLLVAKNETIQILKHQLGINGNGNSKAG